MDSVSYFCMACGQRLPPVTVLMTRTGSPSPIECERCQVVMERPYSRLLPSVPSLLNSSSVASSFHSGGTPSNHSFTNTFQRDLRLCTQSLPPSPPLGASLSYSTYSSVASTSSGSSSVPVSPLVATRAKLEPGTGRVMGMNGHLHHKPKKGGKKNRGSNDKEKTNKPKRISNAYMLFCKVHRPLLKKAEPGLIFDVIGQRLGAAWKALPANLKMPYEEMAERDRVRYQVEKQDYESELALRCAANHESIISKCEHGQYSPSIQGHSFGKDYILPSFATENLYPIPHPTSCTSSDAVVTSTHAPAYTAPTFSRHVVNQPMTTPSSTAEVSLPEIKAWHPQNHISASEPVYYSAPAILSPLEEKRFGSWPTFYNEDDNGSVQTIYNPSPLFTNQNSYLGTSEDETFSECSSDKVVFANMKSGFSSYKSHDEHHYGNRQNVSTCSDLDSDYVIRDE